MLVVLRPAKLLRQPIRARRAQPVLPRLPLRVKLDDRRGLQAAVQLELAPEHAREASAAMVLGLL